MIASKLLKIERNNAFLIILKKTVSCNEKLLNVLVYMYIHDKYIINILYYTYNERKRERWKFLSLLILKYKLHK